MITILLYYIAAPFICGALVLKLLARYGRREIPAEIQKLFEAEPIEKKWFRAVRKDGKGWSALGDYEKQPEAVERIYEARQTAQTSGDKASFLVLNDKGEALEQIDS